MKKNELDHALKVARDAAARAGALLVEGQRRGFEIQNKGQVDLVTEYDLRSEALVVQALREAFPDHQVLGEEGGGRGPDEAVSGAVWYVDPLDGTTNYAHGLPHYAVSIGLELDGQGAVGVVLAPELGWEFYAVQGRGARFNDRPARVSAVPDLDRALAGTGFPYDRRTSPDNNLPQLAGFLTRCQGIRRVGSAALDCAMVAAGMLDLYWEFKVQSWDVAAGALLVAEAGGQVTDTGGGRYRTGGGCILATNGRVHQQALDVLGWISAAKKV